MRVTSPARVFVAILLLVISAALPPAAGTRGRGAVSGTRQPAAGGYHALVIGNNAYQRIRGLKTAESDAREIAEVLRTQYGFQTRLLLNATRQQIISALDAYRRELDETSSLLIYYAGHGVDDREAGRAYWLPVDASEDERSNWISADDITYSIKVIPARHVLIVSDSCYSGKLVTRELPARSPAPAERRRFLARMAEGKSRNLMASGGDEPVVDGGGSKHSVFAGALLRGLRTTDEEQFTGAELFNEYVLVSVAGRSAQTPEYSPVRNSGHESGDFVFVRVGAGGKGPAKTTPTPNARGRQPGAPPAGEAADSRPDYAAWNAIENSTDPQDFEGYIKAFPNGRHVEWARARLAILKSSRPGQDTPAPPSAAKTVMISSASCACLQLTTLKVKSSIVILGSGWDGGSDLKVSVNGRDVSAHIESQNNGYVAVDGTIKELNVRDGRNEVVIVVDGVTSNTYVFKQAIK